MYRQGDLETLTPEENYVTDARADNYGEKIRLPCAHLPHSCDYWIIGGPEEVKTLIQDLQRTLIAWEIG